MRLVFIIQPVRLFLFFKKEHGDGNEIHILVNRRKVVIYCGKRIGAEFVV